MPALDRLKSEAVAEVLVQMLQGTSFGLFATSIQSYLEGRKTRGTVMLVLAAMFLGLGIAYKISEVEKSARETETAIIWE